MPQNAEANQGNQGNHAVQDASRPVETTYDRDKRLMQAARNALVEGNLAGAKRKLAFIHGNKERMEIEAEIEAYQAAAAN